MAPLSSFIPGGGSKANQPDPEKPLRRNNRPAHSLVPGEEDAERTVLDESERLRPAAPPTGELSAPHSAGGSHSH